MKKDFLFQRQHDDVKEMLEKQVLYCQFVSKLMIYMKESNKISIIFLN